jgi:hypothetical protein
VKDLTKTEIKDIVSDEINKFIKSKLDDEVSDVLKKSGSKSGKITADIVKRGLSKLAEFLWIRKNVWMSDIK